MSDAPASGDAAEADALGVDAAPARPAFHVGVAFPVGTNPKAIAIGDLDGDGRSDLAVANSDVDSVSVLLGTTQNGAATPTFANTVDFNVGREPYSVALGDFNADGKVDIVIAARRQNAISVILNTTPASASTPAFGAREDFATALTPQAVAVADLDGDGRPDVAAVSSSGAVSILRNTTPAGATVPSFTPHAEFPTSFVPTSIAIADFNADAKPDLAVATAGSVVSVLLNTTTPGSGIPTFSDAVNMAMGAGVYAISVSVADLNADGNPDLVTPHYTGTSIHVRFGTTAASATVPTFALPVAFTAPMHSQSIAIGDLNGDDAPDLAIAHESFSISIAVNQTAPGAQAPMLSALDEVGVPASSPVVAMDDFNRDGKRDLAVVHPAGTVTVLMAK